MFKEDTILVKALKWYLKLFLKINTNKYILTGVYLSMVVFIALNVITYLIISS